MSYRFTMNSAIILLISSLWLGRRSLRAFATGTYHRPITSVRVLIPHSNIVYQLKPTTTKLLTKFQKRSFSVISTSVGLLLEENIAHNGILAETTTVPCTKYINAWSEWNVSVLPMTLFTICFLIFHERKGGKWSCLVDYTPSVLCPQKKACWALTKGLCVTNVRSFDESLEVITRKTYHELSVFVGGIHQRSNIVCKNSNQCGHD